MQYIPKKIKVCQVAAADVTLKFMLFNQLKFLLGQGYDVHAVCSPGRWVKDFEKEKFYVVHVHTLKPEFYGQIAAKLAGVPVIINTLHGFDFAEDDPFLKKFFYLFLEKIAARCSTLIFSIGYHIITRALQEKIGDEAKLVYLGRDVDTHHFNPQSYPNEFILQKKKGLGIDPAKKVIGIVARLVKEKGYLELFEAFEKVLEQFPDTLLLVVGQEEPEKKDGFTKDIAKDYSIAKNVIFLGERTDTQELYPLMHIFVLPTHREGLGAVILEASAMEKPVIVSNTGGCPEAVDAGKTGILIPVKNSNALLEAMLYLLKNPEAAKKMGQEGRRKIVKEFSDDVVFERLGREYKKLIESK